jgi:hypothetical protein
MGVMKNLVFAKILSKIVNYSSFFLKLGKEAALSSLATVFSPVISLSKIYLENL